MNGFLLPLAVLDSCLGRVLSRKDTLLYFGQLLLWVDSFYVLTVAGLRRTGLDHSCSKTLDSNPMYRLNVLIIRLNMYTCVIENKEAFKKDMYIMYSYTCQEVASDSRISTWKGLPLLDCCRTFLS